MDPKDPNEIKLFKRELKNLFHLYDVDDSGALDVEEMRVFVNDLRKSLYLPHVDDVIFLKLFQALDKDSSQVIELDEMLNNITAIYPIVVESGEELNEKIKDDFEEMDFDDSGFLEREE
jgi:Ca2+-binding EF-hand superfamily protein